MNLLDEIRKKADANGDGKIDPKDLKDFKFGDLLGKVGSIFGK